MTESSQPKSFVRRLGFFSGLLLGLAVPFLGVAALFVAGEIRNDRAPPRHYYAAMIRTAGASLSRQSGAKLVLKDGYETITQECRDVCDDLSLDSGESLYGGYGAQLLDAQGTCVACTWTTPAKWRGMIVTSLAAGGLTKTVPSPSDY